MLFQTMFLLIILLTQRLFFNTSYIFSDNLFQEVEDFIKLEEEIHNNSSYDIDNLGVTYDSDVITEEQPIDAAYDSDVNAEEQPIADELKDVEVVYPSKSEQLLEIEQRKLSSNYLNSFYKCDKCYKGFITDATYRNHMQSHNEVGFPYTSKLLGVR